VKILMLAPDPAQRGPTPKHSPVLVGALRDAGCAVTVLPWGQTATATGMVAKTVDRVRQVLAARRALGSDSFDVMVIKTAHDWATLVRDLVLLIATLGRRPCTVLQFHGSWPPQHLDVDGQRAFRSATALMLRLSDGGLVLSSDEARTWRAFYPEGHFLVVRNPFQKSTTSERRVEDRAAFGIADNEKVVLFVGRLVADKGVGELLTAFASVSQRHPCRLLMLGDGPLAADLAARVRELGLEGSVTFAGYLEGDALDRAYRCADLFTLPSWSEGFSFAIMEAMHAGLPIVTSQIRGMADHLREGEHAVFAKPRDTQGLTEALETLLSDEELRRRLGAANRKKIATFGPGPVADEYLAALRTIHSACGASRQPALADRGVD
jgi:glycosyltransferase involved in cell wall biosynthesis